MKLENLFHELKTTEKLFFHMLFLHMKICKWLNMTLNPRAGLPLPDSDAPRMDYYDTVGLRSDMFIQVKRLQSAQVLS